MKCANHPTQDAVGLCAGCNRALCPECLVGIELALCTPCLTNHNNQVTKHFIKQLLLAGVCGGFTLSLLYKSGIGMGAITLLSLMAAFFPFGWSALSRYFVPGGGYFDLSMRWASLAIHIGVSAMLGWVVGPYQIYKAIRQILKARAANAAVRAG